MEDKHSERDLYYDVRFTHICDTTYALSIQSSAGEANGEFKIPLNDSDLERVTLLREIGAVAMTVGEERTSTYAETVPPSVSYEGSMISNTSVSGEPSSVYLEKIGKLLSEALFKNPSARSLLQVALHQQAIRRQTNRPSNLRIRLELNNDCKLEMLPWEYLCTDKFLSVASGISLVRSMPVAKQIIPRKTNCLKVLVVVGSASDTRLNCSKEVDAIDKALAPLVKRKLVSLTHFYFEDSDTLLRRTMSREKFDVFHYIGHGELDKFVGGSLLAETELRTSGSRFRRLDRTSLSSLLTECPSIGIAIINSCWGAAVTERKQTQNVAEVFLEAGVPAVVAMNMRFSDSAAIAFSESLYESLAQSESIGIAVTKARQRIFDENQDSLEWGAPILYMRPGVSKLVIPKRGGKLGRKRIVVLSAILMTCFVALAIAPNTYQSLRQQLAGHQIANNTLTEKLMHTTTTANVATRIIRIMGHQLGVVNSNNPRTSDTDVANRDVGLLDSVMQFAQSGSDSAQTAVGYAYMVNGYNDENRSNALHWLGLAASQDNSQAQTLLGILYLDTLWGWKQKDNQKALTLFLHASKSAVCVNRSETIISSY